MNLCAECWYLKVRAFWRKPENGEPGEVSPAVRLASASAALCVFCGGPWTPAALAAAPAAYSLIHRADPIIRSWPPGLPAFPDHELPHNEAPELTFDGPAPDQSFTAATFPLAAQPTPVPPPPDPLSAWPTMPEVPRRTLLPGPYIAPTYRVAGPAGAWPVGAASGPGLTGS